MKKNKLFLALLTAMIVLITIFIILFFKQQNLTQSIKTVFPHINTVELPPAIVGTNYRFPFFATIYKNAPEYLSMQAEGLPSGLSLESCSSSINAIEVKQPNTRIMCYISGTPTQDGTFNVKISASYNDTLNHNTTESELTFEVSNH